MCNNLNILIILFSLILHSNKVSEITPIVYIFLSDPLCVEVVQIEQYLNLMLLNAACFLVFQN